jgi:hypothetical protein
MDVRPVLGTATQRLLDARRGNAEQDRATVMDRRDTSFVGSNDHAVIAAILSIACHHGTAKKSPLRRNRTACQVPQLSGIPANPDHRRTSCLPRKVGLLHRTRT